MNYEEVANQQRERNRNILKSLGIYNENEFGRNSPTVKAKKSVNKTSKTASPMPSRRSSRLIGKEPTDYRDIFDKLIIEEPSPKKEVVRVKRDNSFGAIADVPIGTHFSTRLEASHAGIHRPTVAGIHGDAELGCYSIALSGGYAEDVDLGDSFIYTGEGGRDLKGTKANPKNLRTAPQTKNQVLERGNLALSRNVSNQNPVRVLRGYKLNSKFAPPEGYRYDGLYRVSKYYTDTGVAGFTVYKFHFERLENQDSAPWMNDDIENFGKK